jgi:predicted transposase YdaD
MLPEFHYDVIRLWEVDPQPILNEHDVPLYVLLPAMKDPTIDMLRQAIKEIREFYEPERAVEHLAHFTVVLYGTTTVPNKVKDIIEKELSMSSQYVDFMTQNPLFQQMLREREARGKIEMILQLLRIQFSDTLAELVELALRRVDIRNAEVIGPLEEATAHLDEQGVNRWVKDHLPAE